LPARPLPLDAPERYRAFNDAAGLGVKPPTPEWGINVYIEAVAKLLGIPIEAEWLTSIRANPS
jgi:hypothetical protein